MKIDGVELLPCPFCGSPGRRDSGEPNFVRCSSAEVCAGGTWFRLERWQNRKINHADAFNQYAESIEVERKFTAEVLTLIPAAKNLLDELENLLGPSFRNMASIDLKKAAIFLANRLAIVAKRINNDL